LSEQIFRAAKWPLPGLGRHAEWQRVEAGLFGCRAASPRELVVGADKFVRLICANMKYTLNSCREHGLRLWDLYVCWKPAPP
jgi:hypothetical protein